MEISASIQVFDDKGKTHDIVPAPMSFAGAKTTKPRQGGVSFGPDAAATALAKVSGNLCFACGERDLVSTILSRILSAV
jgi:hypothetical protein